MRTRVDAMLQAVQVARPALDKFYQSLSDEQKERFNVIDQEVESTDQRQADIAGLCQRTRRNAGPLLDRTEHILRLSNNQDAALKDLKEASAKAADLLKASCGLEQPITPTGRLAVMEERLNTVLQALDLVKAPLDKLYNSLSDEQKARFNRLSAPSD
jgi:ABC-type transporter MlaC component